MSSSEENEYFSDGMTEEIINALAKIKGLKVTSRTSSFFFKNKNLPISEIGKTLNVSTILEGSIRLAGNRMRITAQLIDVAEDFHFWSEAFDRSTENIFAVQDEISLLIAEKLREHIGHIDIDDQLVEAQNIPIEVYKKYLQGRFHLMKLDLEGTLRGIDIFKEVIEAEPTFALPYLAINQGYAFLGTMGQIPAMEAFATAKPYLDKAIELGEDLPEVQLNLSWQSCWQNWDLKQAYYHIQKAIDTRPTDQIYLTMANFLSVEGKFDLAHSYIDRALQIDPLEAMNHHFKGFLYYLDEKFEEAIPYFEKSSSLKPNLNFPRLYLGQTWLMMGKAEDALAHFQTFPVDVKGDLSKLGGMVLSYALLNDKPKIEIGLEKLQNALQTDSMGSATNFLILTHSMLGNNEIAMDLIEKGINFRLPSLLLLKTEPLVKSLRSEPRFQALMKQMFGTNPSVKFTERKYKKSLFDQETLVKAKEKLLSLMKNDNPFLDPSLSLRSLAQMMDLTPNHLSQLLNEGFDKNFSEFVNTYRLEMFKEKAADRSLNHLTILALAFESGFNSKTVFNTFFRKMEGKTPKAYWREVNGK